MKTCKLLQIAVAGSLLFLLSSCSGIMYLGDHLPASSSIQVYYDAKDVKQNYKVIGHLAVGVSGSTDLEPVKTQMIEKAKSIGADGIIIKEIFAKPGSSNDGSINADAIKFDK